MFFRRKNKPQVNRYEMGYNDGRYGLWADVPVSFLGSLDAEYLKGFYAGKAKRRYY